MPATLEVQFRDRPEFFYFATAAPTIEEGSIARMHVQIPHGEANPFQNVLMVEDAHPTSKKDESSKIFLLTHPPDLAVATTKDLQQFESRYEQAKPHDEVNETNPEFELERDMHWGDVLKIIVTYQKEL